MTDAQQKAWQSQFPKYGLELSAGDLAWEREFEPDMPRVLEIGFGMGDSLVAMAEADISTAFVGIEVHRPGVGRLLNEVDRKGLTNL